jgi:hypothetical protein
LKIELYDLVELMDDLNPKILRGMQGTVIAIYYDKIFEVEFVDSDGYKISYMDQLAFRVTERQIRRITGGPLQPRK